MGGKTSTSFGEKNSPLEKAIKNAHTPEALAKMAQTRHANALIKNEIYNKLKEDLLAKSKNGKTYYSEYLDKFLAEAKKDPNGRCGQTVAGVIFQQDILQLLDEQQEKEMARDLDFMRYRAIKRLFREQRDVVMDTDKRRKIIFCSRRAGKTDCNSTNAVCVAITPNSPILYINKTFIIIDEAGHQRNMKYLINEVLEPALMDFDDSIMILTGTPPRISHTYVEKLWDEGGYEHYHWTMHRNPYIHNVDAEIDRICKEKGLTKDSAFIQREYFGKMKCYDTEAQCFGGRQTYDDIPVDENDRFDLPFRPTNIVIGVDFGYVDNNAVVTLAYNKTTRESVVLPNERLFNKSTITDIIEAVQEQLNVAKELAIKYDIDLATVEVFADNNEKSIISEMCRTYNIPAHTCWKYEKAMAINQLAEELRTGRMKIKKGGKLDEEMDQILYKRDENDNILSELDEDLGIHPDAMFALLYASRQAFLDMGYETGGRSKDEKY